MKKIFHKIISSVVAASLLAMFPTGVLIAQSEPPPESVLKEDEGGEENPLQELLKLKPGEKFTVPNPALGRSRLKLPGIDKFVVQQNLEGKPAGNIDQRIDRTLTYLVTPGDDGGKHELISSSILKGYYSKRRAASRETYIPPGENAEISTHYRGQSSDIYEIDYLKCTKIYKSGKKKKLPPRPIQVEWQTNNINQTGPAEGLPFQIGSLADLANGLLSGNASEILDTTNLPNLTLPDLAQSAGIEELISSLGLDPNNFQNLNPDSWLSDLSWGGLAQVFGAQNPQAIASSRNLEDLGLALVADQAEQALNLPAGSLLGKSAQEILGNFGRAYTYDLFRLQDGVDLKSADSQNQITALLNAAGGNAARVYNIPDEIIRSSASDNPDYIGLGTYFLGHKLLLDGTQIGQLLDQAREGKMLDPDLSRVVFGNDSIGPETFKQLLNANQKQVWDETIGGTDVNQISLERIFSQNYFKLPAYVRAALSDLLKTGSSPSFKDLEKLLGSDDFKQKFIALASGEALSTALDLPEDAIGKIISDKSGGDKFNALLSALISNNNFLQFNDLNFGLSGYGTSDLLKLKPEELAAMILPTDHQSDWANGLIKIGIGRIADITGLPADVLGGLILDKNLQANDLATFIPELLGRWGVDFGATGTIADLLDKLQAGGINLADYQNVNLAEFIGLDSDVFNIPGGKLLDLFNSRDEDALKEFFTTAVFQSVSGNLDIPLELVSSFIFPQPGDSAQQEQLLRAGVEWLGRKIGLKDPGLILDAYLGNGNISQALIAAVSDVTGIPVSFAGDIESLLNGNLDLGARALSAASLVASFGGKAGFGYDIARLATLGIAATQPDAVLNFVTERLSKLPGMTPEIVGGIIGNNFQLDPQEFLNQWLSATVLDTIGLADGSLSPYIFTASFLGNDFLKASSIADQAKQLIASGQIPDELKNALGPALGNFDFGALAGNADFSNWLGEALQGNIDEALGELSAGEFGKNILDLLGGKTDLTAFLNSFPESQAISSILNQGYFPGGLDLSTLGKILTGTGSFEDLQNAGLILSATGLGGLGDAFGLDLGGWGTLAAGLISGNFDFNSIVSSVAAIYGGPIASMALGVLGIGSSSKILCAADYYPEIDEPVKGNPAPIDATTDKGKKTAEYVNARFKVQQVLGQLVDLNNLTKNPDQLPTQIWTLYKDDVLKHWEKITDAGHYGPPQSWDRNGVWPNLLAKDHLHFSY